MARVITQSLLETVRQQANRVSVRFVKSGKWTQLTWNEYLREVELVAAGLIHLGVKPGDRVALMSNTRVEWAVADLAILGIGAVTVPIYSSNLLEDVAFILNNSEASVLLCENQNTVDKWNSIKGKCPSVQNVVSFDTAKDSHVISLTGLKQKGESLRNSKSDFYKKSSESISESDIATIVYTSGTTGTPKGVVLSHRAIMSEVADVFKMIGITPEDISLTFLPFAHILARVEHLGHAYRGFTMGYAENIDRIRANLQDVRPTFMIGVPRIYEKIYSGIISQAEVSPLTSKIFKWAVAIGRQVSAARLERRSPSLEVLIQYQVAKKLVFDKLNERMGGRLRFAISGGAPLSREIAEFFYAANLLILEGYGLTETSAGVFFNAPYNFKFGTVGIAIGDVKCKIAEDGEILVKSDKIMTGYYKDPEATNEVLQDGWFATGDIGEIDTQGFLKITDRKKDLIKTAGGKFVAPQKVENQLKLSKYVSNVLIHGDKRKYVVALLTLNMDNVEAFAKESNLTYNERKELASHPKVYELLRSVVAGVNSQLGSWESIKNFALLANDFTIEAGELTPSLKVKRKFCDKKYAAIIDSLYGTETKNSRAESHA